jgi:hypothetical protein
MALIAVVMMGCSKKDDDNNDDNNNNNPPSTGLTAKIDGTTWTATTSGAVIKNGWTTIAGITGKGKDLTISINSESAGTYTLNENSVHSAILSDGSEFYSTLVDSLAGGEVIISDINTSDSLISGSFHFDIYDIMQTGFKKSVTEGSFKNIKFTSNTNGGGNNNDGTMQLDVDGTTWVPEIVSSVSAIGTLALVGKESNSDRYVSFLFPDTITTGNFDLANYSVLYVNSEGLTFLLTSGTLDITTHNTSTNKFEGTFSFEGSDYQGSTVSVTNGEFSATYQEAKK